MRFFASGGIFRFGTLLTVKEDCTWSRSLKDSYCVGRGAPVRAAPLYAAAVCFAQQRFSGYYKIR